MSTKKWRGFWVYFILMFSLFGTVSGEEIQSEKSQADKIMTVMHTNDIHGRLAGNGKDTLGMARLKTYKDEIQPTLLVDAGDVFQGLPISNFSKGMDMAKAMNLVGYDAMAVGNHEFDFGLETALQYREVLNFPILSTNTYQGDERIFEPYTIVEKAGKKYAIIGVTTPETATKTHPNNVRGLTFKDPIPEVTQVMNEIIAQHPEIAGYVVTGHLGIDPTTPSEWRGDTLAQALAKTFPTLNIVSIDGHSHTAVPNGKHYQNVMYAQTGNYLNNVGVVTASVTDVQQKEAHLVRAESLAHLAENPDVLAVVQQAQANFAAWSNEVAVENNPYFFEGQRENVRTRETNLGNLLSDALLHYSETGFETPADFAVTNGGGIRADLRQGPITAGDVVAVLPFGNTIAQINVTGQQVKEMFEMSVRSQPQQDVHGQVLLDDVGQPKLGANGGFLHASRTIRVYYDATKQGTLLSNDEGNTTGETQPGERVLQIEIFNRQTGAFEPIVADKVYKMATNDFIAAGGDGYDMLGGEREEGPSMDGVLLNYLKQPQLDLSSYETPYPNARIISIAESAWEKLHEKEQEKETTPSSESTEQSSEVIVPKISDETSAATTNETATATIEIVDETRTLPQTNMIQQPWFSVLGGCLLFSVSIIWFRKQR